MKRQSILFEAVFLKSFRTLKRYPINTVTQLVTVYVLFVLVFFGGKRIVGSAITDSLEGIIVGFFLYSASTMLFFGVASNLVREAQWGTLEQLYMTPFGMGQVVIVKAIVNLVWSFLSGVTVLVALVLTTRPSLTFELPTVFTVSILTLLPAIGVGLGLAGLALIYKRVEAVFQLVQFLFITLIAAPTEEYPVLKFLPLSLGYRVLKRTMANGLKLWQVSEYDLTLLFVVGIFYAGCGYVLFYYAQSKARELGVLGDY